VTGRRRRCGWFDAVALRRSIVHNSCSLLCVTKLDVLDGLDIIRVCVGYKTEAGISTTPPLLSGNLSECQAVYEEMAGWKESTVGITSYDDLPANARKYLERLQVLVGVPITIISTGPDRDQTIIRQNPFS
jgi:adenylosuccinate synthase